jgi:murein DD-endopeptidase MepM/ murein hydrolase activator NlpD
VDAAAVELSLPGQRSTVLAERSPNRGSRPGALVYPFNGSLVSIGSLQVDEDCSRARPSGRVEIGSLSLFRGTVTAAAVSIDARAPLRSPRIGVNGLRVDGRIVTRTIRRSALGRWGLLTVGPAVTRRRGSGRAAYAGALVVRLLQAHAGLPAGTTLRVAFAAVRRPSTAVLRHRARAPAVSRPLKVTPPLGRHGYVFPVVGNATFWDSYGAFRPDVSGNWHHGDDIFAAVGTPVVAVANGTLNRVGWEPIGGWRLWVRDLRGNEFYYAHLSGYTPQPLRSTRVTAGEVLGFVGNTGDAFTTPFHLHFEVHPHQLLYLKYNGAVDPTTYLDHWQHLRAAQVPKPMLPATLPAGDPRREARFVFRELLVARGLTHHAPSTPPRIRIPGHEVAVRPFTAALASGASVRGHRSGALFIPVTLTVVALALVLGGATTVVIARRRKSGRDAAQPAGSEPA